MSSKDLFYKRQVTLAEVGEQGQIKLGSSHVLVVGAGGLGCPVLEYLTAAGVGTITICDYDKVDYTNLHRQVLYTPDDIGKFKAEVAAKRLRKQNPHIVINTILKKIDLTSELHTYDLIIDCSDNFKTKFSLHDLCFQNKKTLIQGSIHKFEGQIQLFNFSKDLAPEKPCLRCLWPKTPAKSCVQTCSEAGVLGVVPGVIGSLQAAEAIKFLLELPTLNTGETLIINLFNFSTQKIKWSIDKNCPLCQQKDVLLTNFSYGESVFEVSFQELEKNDCHFIDLTKVPDSQVLKQISKINDQAKIILYCYHGVTSLKKTHSLRSQGFSNCFSLKGGINENAQCLN